MCGVSIIIGANILRDSNGNVKIADFGASKKLHVSVSLLSYDPNCLLFPYRPYIRALKVE